MISSSQNGFRVGIDLGGFKIEGILMDSGATELAHYRISTPSDDYAATIAAIRNLTAKLIQGITSETKIGIGVPGSISPVSRLIQNANSRWLNGHPLDVDLEVALGLPVRLANDANQASSRARLIFRREGAQCSGRSSEQDAVHVVVDRCQWATGCREWVLSPWAMADAYPCTCGKKDCLRGLAYHF
jgi:fructokinase